MTHKLIPVPLADIEALRQVRTVIADATGHPAQKAAIEAIDRIGAAPHPQTLLEFIEAAWPALHPGETFVATPMIALMCDAIETLTKGGKEAEGLKFTVERGKRVRRREEAPLLIIDDPRVATQAAPPPDAVKLWCDAAGVCVPAKPAAQRPGDIVMLNKPGETMRISTTSTASGAGAPTHAVVTNGVVPQRQCNHEMYARPAPDDLPSDLGSIPRVCYVCGVGVSLTAGIRMPVIINGEIETRLTCGDPECRDAAVRTNTPADAGHVRVGSTTPHAMHPTVVVGGSASCSGERHTFTWPAACTPGATDVRCNCGEFMYFQALEYVER